MKTVMTKAKIKSKPVPDGEVTETYLDVRDWLRGVWQESRGMALASGTG